MSLLRDQPVSGKMLPLTAGAWGGRRRVETDVGHAEMAEGALLWL